jgi:hypothetical protein
VLAGGRLRSDDVVTLVRDDTDKFLCESGSLALRMRQPIAGRLPDTLSVCADASADNRQLYHGTSAIPAMSPVIAVLFPQLEAATSEVTLEPLSALDGFRRLAQEPRVTGVQERAHVAARVAELTALCGSVPLRLVRMTIADRDLAVQGAALMARLRADPELCAP